MKKSLFVFGMIAAAITESYAGLTEDLKNIMENNQPTQQMPSQQSNQPSGTLTQTLQQMQATSMFVAYL